MKDITLRSYLLVTSRKRNDQGKLITNVLTKDLKIKEGDLLIVSTTLKQFDSEGKAVDVMNDNNNLIKRVRTSQFYRMFIDSCDFEEYLLA